MGMEDFRRIKTTVSPLNYHFVFCPRYRRKIFLNEQVDLCFKELVQQICEKKDVKIVAMETDKDHCHLLLNVPPTYSLADVMAKVKGGTSKILREEFPHLNRMLNLWTHSYSVSTVGNVSSQTMKRYVEIQRKLKKGANLMA